MGTKTHIYGEINNKTDLKEVSMAIRKDVESADSREALTELYKRAGYLVTLSYSPAWEKKFGERLREVCQTAEEEFRITARKINQRAKEIGIEADYDEAWGKK
ncbi:MAG: hypothetical protein LLH30_19005 [Candidatus Manganitrophus sp. SA1]|nr:hypothetical protein [Candidatus Manganitrophus morganii]